MDQSALMGVFVGDVGKDTHVPDAYPVPAPVCPVCPECVTYRHTFTFTQAFTFTYRHTRVAGYRYVPSRPRGAVDSGLAAVLAAVESVAVFVWVCVVGFGWMVVRFVRVIRAVFVRVCDLCVRLGSGGWL